MVVPAFGVRGAICLSSACGVHSYINIITLTAKNVIPMADKQLLL